jgi:hypothetical protein
MPAPFTPNDFKEVIPSPGGNFCVKFFKNFLRRFPTMIYGIISYERDENGDLSDEMKTDICQLDCMCGGGGTVEQPPTGLDTPRNVSATDGTYADKVRVTWTTVGGATRYYIYRSTSSVTPSFSTTPIASVDAPVVQYDDLSAALGTVYYYWVRAVSATDVSDFSASDSGYIENVSSNEVRFESPGVTTWTVPPAVTSIDVRTVGGGGSGGGGTLARLRQGAGGGGGGGGGYSQTLNIPVTAGETLTIEVGSGGIHPGGSIAKSQSLNLDGSAGTGSSVKRNSTTLISSLGGGGGLKAVAGANPSGGAGGAGGTGSSTTGTAGGIATSQGSFSVGGFGGQSGGSSLYASKGSGGMGQTIAGILVDAGEGGGGGTVGNAAPYDFPKDGENGIVVIFY